MKRDAAREPAAEPDSCRRLRRHVIKANKNLATPGFFLLGKQANDLVDPMWKLQKGKTDGTAGRNSTWLLIANLRK